METGEGEDGGFLALRMPLYICAVILLPASAQRADLGGREFYPRHRNSVVAPSLTPESYNLAGKRCDGVVVVAPSLTPESYNRKCGSISSGYVVAPSLTPESYN